MRFSSNGLGRLATLFVAIGLNAACLEPGASDDVDSAFVFGDPTIAAEDALHVEDDPDFAARVEQFPETIPYINGYAAGEKIWYWRLTGVTDFIVPYYVVTFADGSADRAIVDLIPGDTGYSPWWRRVVVRTTDKYAGEKIWSRAAVEVGIREGLLAPVEETTRVITAPIVKRSLQLQVDAAGTTVSPTWAWYRNRRVSWIEFESDIEVAIDERDMPRAPVYEFERINEAAPLFELTSGIDLDGDGKLLSSNNIFQTNRGDPRYTPMWYPIRVRTTADYPSIESATVGFTSESQFIGAEYGVVISSMVVPPLQHFDTDFEIGPIQRAPGSL